MRASLVLLFSTCFASSAFALTPLTPPTPMPGVAAVTTTMPPMIGGKFVVGYEGRGDYLKNDELEKHSSGTVPKAPVGTSLAEEMANQNNPAPVAPAPAVTQRTTTPDANLRSDSALSSDNSKAKAAAATAAPEAAKPAAAPAPTPGAPNYNPMVLIGGKIQQQH